MSGESSKIYFYDGTTAELKKGVCYDLKFDINGEKKPNKQGDDRFHFLICPYGNLHTLYPGEKLSTYDALKGPIRDKAYEACKNDPNLCTRLLQFDNWEFKDDYPYKL